MKLNINSARKGNSSYTFSPISLVSLDFGRLQPTRSFSLVLGDKFPKVSATGLLRCTPQVFPPFGRMNLKSAAFFVPDSQIFSWSSAFHSDNKLWRGQIADSAPCFNATDFNYLFASNYITGSSTLVIANPAVAPARNTYDFAIPSANRIVGNTNLEYYKLTPFGWKHYAVFKALGYDFVTFPTDTTGGALNVHIAANETRISAVPFLAHCKIWNDYFCNSYQSDKNEISTILQKIYLNKDVVIAGNTWYTASTFTVDFTLLLYMAERLTLPYESNMYTNAWNNPNDPTGVENVGINQVSSQSLISPFGRDELGEFKTLRTSPLGNTHQDYTSSHGGITVAFSQLGHRTLQAFDNFVRRRNLIGSKAVQQLYALFGIEPDEWNKDYVVKLAENSNRIQFSAISSQSDTVNGSNGKPLGAFAGTGIGGYNLQFGYEANTYGTIVCLCWLNIDPILIHGMHPDVLRVKPLDFYNPDWDGKSYRPIPYCEVTGAKAIDKDAANAIKIYGYTNMYDDYRMMRDVVAGSFSDDTTRNFAFMRDLTDTRNIMESNSLQMYPQTSEVQYWHIDGSSDVTNPFLTVASAGDRFWFCIDWDIKCTRPMLSNENSFDLEGEGSISIKKNGDGMA